MKSKIKLFIILGIILIGFAGIFPRDTFFVPCKEILGLIRPVICL